MSQFATPTGDSWLLTTPSTAMTFLPTDSGASKRSQHATPMEDSWLMTTPSPALTFLPTDSGASKRSQHATPMEDSRLMTTPSPAMTWLPTDSGASERSQLATPMEDRRLLTTPSTAMTWLPTDSGAPERSQHASPMEDSRLLTTPSPAMTWLPTDSGASSSPSVRYERFPDHAASPESVRREDELARRRKLFFEEMSFEEDLKWDKNPSARLTRHQNEEEAFLSKIEDFQLDFSPLADDPKPDVTGTQSSPQKSTEAPTIEECLGHKPSEPWDGRRLFRFEIAVKYDEWVNDINQPEGVSELPPCEF